MNKVSKLIYWVKQNLKIIFGLVVIFVMCFSIVSSLAAQTPSPDLCPDGLAKVGGKCPLRNPDEEHLVNINSFGELIKRVISILLLFAGAIAVVFLLVGGYQYIASRGNEEAMEAAKKTVTSAVIGIIIIVLAFAIVSIVNTLLTKPATKEGQTGFLQKSRFVI